ncbi:restriction endonuclease subunit S [Staphylococcus haemolyticus]|uniref:restriction endonuclease subunit S n=1 Tax=Staphylococcus haemolyticus TaxID=1283 RepID=UPI001F0A824A|nr:restriction endonuclease subunit S [Staphylococcus haemolyticus]MCH4417228.1 restriction endonuclease subunit S [Staphylococcus haemolyticus]
MTEKTNTPELRFPEFREGWKEFILNDVSIKKSKKNKNNLYNETFTNSAEYGIVSQKEYFDKEISNKKNLNNYYIVEPNDFVYNPRISNLAPVGPINRNKLNRTGVMSPLYTVFSTKLSIKSFLEYYFKTSKWHRFMKLNGDSGARSDRFTIKQSLFIKMPIFLPSNQEQEKIGDFFSKLDRQIELEEQKLEKLEEQKKGYMQQIFSQELRFKDESENDYPEWKERKFSELLSYSSNGVDKKINKNHDIAYMVNYMDVLKKTKLNTKNRDLLMKITATKVQKEKNNLKKGDILFTPSSETREDIAKSTVVFEDLDNTVYSYHLIRLRPLDSNIFSLKYSNYLSEQNFISKQFRRLAQGAQRYTLTKEYFENIKLNLPHIKEQEKIGDFFSKLDEVINKQSQKIDELKLRKQGFLQKMFV